jgi:hypothetical protein
MQNLTVHLSSTTPLSSRAGPRAPARHPRLPALTAAQATPTTGPPLSFLSLSTAPTTAPLKRDHAHSFSRLHSSSTPPLERPSLPTAPCTRTAASGHRQPTLPRGFRPSTATLRHSPVSSSPSYQSLQFLTIFSPLASPVLQDPTLTVATHRSPLPTDERHCPTPFAPPHRRPAVPVRPCPLLLAPHLPRDPLEVSGNTLPSSSHR